MSKNPYYFHTSERELGTGGEREEQSSKHKKSVKGSEHYPSTLFPNVISTRTSTSPRGKKLVEEKDRIQQPSKGKNKM